MESMNQMWNTPIFNYIQRSELWKRNQEPPKIHGDTPSACAFIQLYRDDSDFRRKSKRNNNFFPFTAIGTKTNLSTYRAALIIWFFMKGPTTAFQQVGKTTFRLENPAIVVNDILNIFLKGQNHKNPLQWFIQDSTYTQGTTRIQTSYP